MLSNPIVHRILASPLFYQWLLATVSPFVIWAVLAMLSRRHPGILERVFPFLRILVWGLWGAAIGVSLYNIFFIVPGTSHFYVHTAIPVSLSGGMNLVYRWVRDRVSPPRAKEPEYGWLPTPKDS
jgi:hypothetical protein